jgi:hypothetical protein
VIAPGDTQALPRIPVPGTPVDAGLPTVALTLGPAAPEGRTEGRTEARPAPEVVAPADPEPATAEAASHERIYEEAMATIAALASTWSTAVQQASGRHRAAA